MSITNAVNGAMTFALAMLLLAACTPETAPPTGTSTTVTQSATCTPQAPKPCAPEPEPEPDPCTVDAWRSLFRSPDGSFFALGLPPSSRIIRAADGVTVPAFSGLWREGTIDTSGNVRLLDFATRDVVELGVAYGLRNESERLWLQRGAVGPYTVVDKATLVETTVAQLGSNLRLTTAGVVLLDVDVAGTTVPTILSPIHLPLDASSTSPTVTRVGDRLLVSQGLQLKLVEITTGAVTDLTGSGRLTASGTFVWHDGATVNALDLDGTRRLLCTGTSARLAATTVACDRSVVVEIASGREIGRGTSITTSNTLSYADTRASTIELFFDDGHVSVPRAPTGSQSIQFTTDGQTAMIDGTTTTFVNATGVVHVQPGRPYYGLERGFALYESGPRWILLSLADFTTVETDPVVAIAQDLTTANLFTIERPPGAVDNVVRHYRQGRPPVDLMTGGNALRYGDQGTAIVSVEDPGNPDCRNGLYAVRAPD